MNEHVRNNKVFDSFTEFKAKIRTFLIQLGIPFCLIYQAELMITSEAETCGFRLIGYIQV